MIDDDPITFETSRGGSGLTVFRWGDLELGGREFENYLRKFHPTAWNYAYRVVDPTTPEAMQILLPVLKEAFEHKRNDTWDELFREPQTLAELKAEMFGHEEEE